MRVNVYNAERTTKIDILSAKTDDGESLTGIRFYVETPVNLPLLLDDKQRGIVARHMKAPYVIHEKVNLSSAVTFWGVTSQIMQEGGLRHMLAKAVDDLDAAYEKSIFNPVTSTDSLEEETRG